MHEFKFKNGELFCENVRVSDIASENRTPFYLYSRRTFEQHYSKLDKAFNRVPNTICYSLKANSNIEICKLLAGMGAGADIVSGGELMIALASGIPPEKIVYAGVGKTEEEIRSAVEKGILMFNVESEQELERINKISGEAGKISRAALRLNPDVDASTHEYITTGRSENKFGLAGADVERLFLNSASFPNVDMAGIHIHIGSQIVMLDPYIEAVGKTAEFIKNLRGKGLALRWLNIGGGLGIRYKDEEPSTADEFAEAVLPELESTGLDIIMEPGRFIAGNSGILVAKVLYVKKTAFKTFVIIDAGMNDLFRPALYRAYHDIQPLVLKGGGKITADIVGPVCESGDFFALGRELPEVERGDLIAIFSAGAYGYSMASNYNMRPRPAELLVEGDKFRVIREREKLAVIREPLGMLFTKMCAGGNDFIVIDNSEDFLPDRSGLARQLCPRARSVGADGLILIEKASVKPGNGAGAESDFRMRIFNPDGSEAEMCGNGARCAAAFAFRKGITRNRDVVFETLAGRVRAEVADDGSVRLLMNTPSPVETGLSLRCGEDEFMVNSINTGVPHAVILVDDIEKADVTGAGRRIRMHPRFQPSGTNVDFVEVTGCGSICMRTYERGVEAETLSCGTGAVASAVICSLLDKVAPPVEVKTSGGSLLKVYFNPTAGGAEDVYLEGDAGFVYEGSLRPERACYSNAGGKEE